MESIRDKQKIRKKMVLEYLPLQVESLKVIFTRENGKMVKSMEKEYIIGKMGIGRLESIIMTKHMEMQLSTM